MDDLSTVLVALAASVITALATIIAQIIINRQIRSDFLKEKSWSQLLSLVESLSTLSIYMDDVLDHQDKSNGQKKEVDVSQLMSHFDAMKQAQPYIYMTGSDALIRAFNHLYLTLQFIEKHLNSGTWKSNVEIRYRQLSSQSVIVIKRISKFMHS